MAETPQEPVYEVVAQLRELLGVPGVEEPAPRTPLPDDWRTDPVKCLIAMVVADPTPAGAAAALAWFYGRGLPDPNASAPGDGVLDVGALVLEVLRSCVESAGIDEVRRQITAAMGEP